MPPSGMPVLFAEAGAGNPWQLLPLAAVLAASFGIFLLLPSPKGRPRFLGYLIVLGALAAFLASWTRSTAFSLELALQQVFSAAAILGAVFLVTQPNPARAALSFTLAVLGTSGLYLTLGAPFLAAANVIVYAGAIIVTFLFVLMLAQQDAPSDSSSRSRDPFMAALTGGLLLFVIAHTVTGDRARLPVAAAASNPAPVMPSRLGEEASGRADASGRLAIPAENTAFLGADIYRNFLIGVEVAGVLLVVATVAAIVIAQRKHPAVAGAGVK
ncbi:MAG: NADH-quinone oxidoreductase subunit J [Gemmataceae bacterium]